LFISAECIGIDILTLSFYNFRGIVKIEQLSAWGNILSATGSMASSLGLHNPLRYRGYVYDNETGLYYLQSRYYNPTIGRFINVDALIATGQGILANNMFAYCSNNPVKNADHLGLFGICVLDDPMNVNRAFMTPGMFGAGGGNNVAGVGSSYYARQNVSAYDRYWRNSGSNPNMTRSTGSGNVTTQLQNCADIANAQISGVGSVAGTYKHSAFSTGVKNLGNPSLRTEVSYLNGKEVPYGTKGSIRFDVMLFNGDTPVAAWDFKTGAAILTDSRISKMQKQSGLPDIPIYMIK
jgi:RHS repeat-associated protein